MKKLFLFLLVLLPLMVEAQMPFDYAPQKKDAWFNGKMRVKDSLGVDGTVRVTGEVDMSDSLTVTKNIRTTLLDVNSTSDFLGAATFNGGVVLPYSDPIIWAKGGSVVLATAGTDVTPTAGTIYWVEVVIPYNVTLTGINYLIGSVGGTDSVMVALHNSAGTQVAVSTRAQATNLVGTAANLQAVPFSTTYAAVAGRYFASVQVSGNTCRLRAYPIPGSKFVASSTAGTYGTIGTITPGSTFTADKGIILSSY